MTKKKYFRSIQPDFFLKKTIKDINKGVLFVFGGEAITWI